MQTLRFGAAATEMPGTYVQVDSQPVLYLVETAKAERIINTTALALRDRTILRFEPHMVQKIHMQYPTSSLTIERQGKTWRLSEPTRQTIPEPWVVDNLLYDLGALKYERMATDSATNGSDAGIETPQVRISL